MAPTVDPFTFLFASVPNFFFTVRFPLLPSMQHYDVCSLDVTVIVTFPFLIVLINAMIIVFLEVFRGQASTLPYL